MSKLLNGVICKSPQIDNRIAHKITVLATIEIPDNIINIFERVSIAIADQLEYDKMKIIPRVNCLFISGNEFTIRLDDIQSACCFTDCVYPIDKLVQDKRTDMQLALIITEELCHTLWCIESEYHVCFKVLEVLKRIYPKIKIEDLYNMDEVNKVPH